MLNAASAIILPAGGKHRKISGAQQLEAFAQIPQRHCVSRGALEIGISQQAFKGGDFGIDGVDAFKRFFH